MERTAYMHLQAGGRSGGPARRVLRFSAFLSAAGQHGRPRRHRPPRSATTSFCHRPPPPPHTAQKRLDRLRRHRPPHSAFLPQTAPAATDRPAAQLLPHNARGLLIGNRRHRPPRSATTSFCHRPPPPPQTAPQRARKNAAATDRPGTRGARLADWQKRRRHRPPRSATTSFYHRQPPPPQTAPQRNYCPTTRAAC